MGFTFFDNRRTRQVLSAVFLSGALICIFPTKDAYAVWWAALGIKVALWYLLIGMFFFIINRRRLMYVCLGCCAVIAFYHQEIAPLKNNETESPIFVPMEKKVDDTLNIQ